MDGYYKRKMKRAYNKPFTDMKKYAKKFNIVSNSP